MTIRFALSILCSTAAIAAAGDVPGFGEKIKPLLEAQCFDCHADGAKKGGVAFDEMSEEALLADKALWHRVLKNVRAGLMPPPDKKTQPTAEERSVLVDWVKRGVFKLDAAKPDPGRPVLRRLNRTEYRNTVRDLTGVEFRVDEEFPADDAGHGFDNIGEVLNVSPLLLERYLAAAKSIVQQALPKQRGEGKWFPREAPADAAERAKYAREVLSAFARRAFRRPVEAETVDRLVKIAEAVWAQPGESFESGVGRALEAVLASPRFIFREEFTEPANEGAHPFVDQYALASRLSYFLWSTLPDAPLLEAAEKGLLRAELGAHLQRMLADDRAKQFIRNFTGQWLQARDIEGIPIDARFVLLRQEKPDPEAEAARKRFFELRQKREDELTPEEREEMRKSREIFRKAREKFEGAEFSGGLRRDMRRETEMYFDHIIRGDRPLTELIDSRYTFLNERLARHYGVPGVQGDDFRQVTLPNDSPRGGVLTMGTVLAVTSNPTRTSPVKRGLFILENVLGTPPPPPPANVPPLEDFGRGRGFELNLRESLARHRADAACASCHNRMDPLGLAFENFNAMASWRDEERGIKVEAGGELMSGEKFNGARELKQILVTKHREEFYRCFIEKMLLYALGRGLTWEDETTIELLLERLNKADGRAGAVLQGIVESDAFLRRRAPADK